MFHEFIMLAAEKHGVKPFWDIWVPEGEIFSINFLGQGDQSNQKAGRETGHRRPKPFVDLPSRIPFLTSLDQKRGQDKSRDSGRRQESAGELIEDAMNVVNVGFSLIAYLRQPIRGGPMKIMLPPTGLFSKIIQRAQKQKENPNSQPSVGKILSAPYHPSGQ